METQWLLPFMSEVIDRWEGVVARSYDYVYARKQSEQAALTRWLAMFSPLGNGGGQ